MRIELTQIERIENYLLGTMSTGDKNEFEKELNSNPELRSQLDIQTQIAEGIRRIGLTTTAQKSYKKYKAKLLWTKVIVGLGIAAIVGGTIFAVLNTAANEKEPLTEANLEPATSTHDYVVEADKEETVVVDSLEDGTGLIEGPQITDKEVQSSTEFNTAENNNSSANSSGSTSGLEDLDELNPYLETEIFTVSTDRDTVLESKDGLVLYLPDDAFETSSKEVDVILQTAIKTEDILYAGLNTKTLDGVPLQTAGMFYLTAKNSRGEVALKREIVVDIPTAEIKSGMELFRGERSENNELLWTNPRPLEKPLIPMDILTLDFYPPNYEPSMNAWGFSEKDFLDSMYYSFSNQNYESDLNTLIAYSNGDFDGSGMTSRRVNYESYSFANVLPNRIVERDRSTTRSGRKLDGRVSTGTMNSYDISRFGTIMNKSENQPYIDMTSKRIKTVSNDSVWFKVRSNINNTAILECYIQGTNSDLPNAHFLYGAPNPATPNIEDEGMLTLFLSDLNITEGCRLLRIDKKVRKGKGWDWEARDNEQYAEVRKYDFLIEFTSAFSQLKLNYAYQRRQVTYKGDRGFGNGRKKVRFFSPVEDSVLITFWRDDSKDFINPASVKTIWDRKFNETNLATKAFEERMEWIHESCDQRVLDVYINNLNLPLHTVDSMAARRAGDLEEKFYLFGARGEGQVELEDEASKELTQYYKKRREEIINSVSEEQANFWKEQDSLDRDFDSKSNMNQLTNLAAASDFKGNVDRSGFSEGNIATQNVQGERSSRVYRARINISGWFNCDNVVGMVGGILTAPLIGVGAIAVGVANGVKNTVERVKEEIRYKDWSATVKDEGDYDRVNLYLVPTHLTSYLKINKGPAGNYTYEINGDYDYKTLVMAWRGSEIYYSLCNTKKNDGELELALSDDETVKSIIRQEIPNVRTLTENVDYVTLSQANNQRKKENDWRKEFREKVKPAIFPCLVGENNINDNFSGKEDVIVPEYLESNEPFELKWNIDPKDFKMELIGSNGELIATVTDPNGSWSIEDDFEYRITYLNRNNEQKSMVGNIVHEYRGKFALP